jgi:hypothetical protein
VLGERDRTGCRDNPGGEGFPCGVPSGSRAKKIVWDLVRQEACFVRS